MSTTTVSIPSPSGSWSPGGFPPTDPRGRPEAATPPSAGQVSTPFRGKEIDQQPLRDASPSYFNIISDTNTLHVHFTPQVAREPAAPIYARTQRHFVPTPGAGTPRPNDAPSILPVIWQSSHTLLGQNHEIGNADGSTPAASFMSPPAWPWKAQPGGIGQERSDREGAPPSITQKPAFNLPPSIPTARVGRSGPPHVLDYSTRAFPSSTPMIPNLQRSETSPGSMDQAGIKMISSQTCKDLLTSHSDVTLILDIRPFPQHSQGRIKGSLNFCIPTTLLKRPSFNLQKLGETLTSKAQKERFFTWRDSTRIVAYDASTTLLKDAASLINVLKKFTVEGWDGEPLILRGGFSEFSKQFPAFVEHGLSSNDSPSAEKSLSIGSLTLPGPQSLTGGCFIPKPSPSVHPLYNSIRQTTDLVDGVGKLPVKLPARLTERARQALPAWLVKASDVRDRGETIAAKFLQIERAEQTRMQQAFSDGGTYNSTPATSPKQPSYRIAGIEMGTKNRYNNIYPFEHCRVKLGSMEPSSCDYVNASHIKASRSNKLYIATQAPLPSTFTDFWHVVWEQDSRLIVMLTAETEGPQLKCHPYWKSAVYGHLRVDLINEYKVPITSMQSSPISPTKRTHSRRESTGSHPPDEPHIIVRHLTLIHDSLPFAPMREVTQLQYSHWPDFGTPAQPAHLLRLIEETNRISNLSNGRNPQTAASEPEPSSPRKIIVHCSAGCGRTGTFCTVDSVIDMLKRQKKHRPNEDSWVYCDDVDLIASTVEDFRHQRLSMVQTLRQFVLCYESVLEWLASQS